MLTLIIGRGSECDFVVSDDTVSRRHAVMVIEGDNEIRVADSNSTNGTFVFDSGFWMRTQQCRVRSKDRLKFGEVEVAVADILAHVATLPSGGASGRGSGAARPAGPPPSPAPDVRRPGAQSGGGSDAPDLEKFKRPYRDPITGDIVEG